MSICNDMYVRLSKNLGTGRRLIKILIRIPVTFQNKNPNAFGISN